MKRLALAALALVSSGCRPYAVFTLPPLPGGSPSATYAFEQRMNAVLSPGQGWDSRDVLNPVVVDGTLNLYSGFDGKTWRTGLAVFSGGAWQKQGMVLEPDPNTWEGTYIAANGAALRDSSGLRYWYVSGPRERPRLGLARSGDGRAWVKNARPVLEPGPYASWDEFGVADPWVLRAGPYLYLYSLGQDRGWRQRIGVARSTDGLRWEKLRSGPVLELGEPGTFDENGLGEPAIWNASGYYWMLYTGRGAGEVRKLGLARSTDGVHWQKIAVFGGAQPWNSQALCDPSIEIQSDGRVGVWFGGGNVPRPDENLNGQIGYGILSPAH
jgi:predicted GH43/DUF377 family glycosyl hydrolase